MTDENISIENTAAPQAEPAVQQSNVVDTVVKSEPTTFNQDQVNIISADTKRRTEERVRAEVKAEYESRYGAKPNLSTPKRGDRYRGCTVITLHQSNRK